MRAATDHVDVACGHQSGWRETGPSIQTSAVHYQGTPYEIGRHISRSQTLGHALTIDFRIALRSNHFVTGSRDRDMLTGIVERDLSHVLRMFGAGYTSRAEPRHEDRKFLEALHYFIVHTKI
jgi:hypothetical protein